MEMHFGEPPAGEGRQLRLEEILTALHTVLTIIQVLLAVAMVAIVSLQSGKSSGLSSAIAGGDNSFMGKNKSKALDAKLAGATKWIGAAFLVLTFALNLF